MSADPTAETERLARLGGARQTRSSTGNLTNRLARGELQAALRAPFLRSLLRVPLKKIAIWGSFLGVLYFLREFFAVMFLTFVLSYISLSIVGRISSYFSSRKVPVLLVFGLLVGSIVGLGFATLPRAARQGQAQLKRMQTIKDPKAFLQKQLTKLTDGRPWLSGLKSSLDDPAITQGVVEWLVSGREKVIAGLGSLVGGIWTGVVNVGLALIFAFFVVWDLPRLSEGIGRLEHSRWGDVWGEVAPSIVDFFHLLGKAFEAQTMIALVNTALTALGLSLLGIPGIPFLSVVVFVCSFIPIVGVFISTVPICLVALQGDEGGLGLALGVIVMVTVVHMIEAYVLNPRIYGFHMKLHPLAVLVVLYLGQHLFGVWGLIIGVPFATYVWRHLIMGQGTEPEALAAPSPAAPAAAG